MNERIRQFAIEADIMAPTWNHVPLGYQKFAELIVKECMDVLDPGDHQLIARFHTRQWLSEHFGIK